MQTSNDYMTKRFGASGINREMFTDCFEGVISMDKVSDEAMQKLADEVESVVRQQFPDVADKLFELWQKDDLTDDEYDMMAIGEYKAAFDTYWEQLGSFAIKAGGEIYKNGAIWQP
jgi:hypothetical protein